MNSDKLKELLEKNSNYWQSRALDSEIRAVENEEDYLKRIKGILKNYHLNIINLKFVYKIKISA